MSFYYESCLMHITMLTADVTTALFPAAIFMYLRMKTDGDLNENKVGAD